MTHPTIEYLPRRDTTKYDDRGSRLSGQIRGPLKEAEMARLQL